MVHTYQDIRERAMQIDTALADKHLLGAALGDTATWATWLATLKAAFGLQLTRQERKAFASVAGSRKPPQQKVKELWAIAGRGSGKSRIAAAIAVYVAAFLRHDLDPGEQGFVLCLAANRDQASVVFNYALAFMRRSPILKPMISSYTQSEIKFNNRVTIAVHTNSFRSIRGRALLAVIGDETAWWRDDASANPDVEVYRACQPSLLRCNGIWVGISSPYRRAGLLFNKFATHFDNDDDDVLVVNGPTTEFNPTIDRRKIDKAIAADPEAGRAEWLAEFRSDLSALFDDSVIDEAVEVGRPLELPPRLSNKYFAFVDASAGRHDAFTICLSHIEGGKDDTSWVCDVIRGRASPFDPRSVAEEYSNICRDYAITTITGDNFAGQWVAQAFGDAGMRYETCKLNKSALYLESLPHFNRGAVLLPDHPKLLKELRCLERRVHRSGRDSVDHPSNGTDDYANAVAGSLYVAMNALHAPRMRQGAIAMATTGKITWDDDEPQHLRIKHVYVTEAGDVLREQVRLVRRTLAGRA